MLKSPAESGFYPGVEALRGWAVAMVFAHHVYTNTVGAGFWPLDAAHPISVFLDGCRFGVELFFAISGFVICLSLSKASSSREFLKRRALRLYPAFLVLHVAVFAVGPLVGYRFLDGIGPVDWGGAFVANLVFLPGLLDLPIAQIVAWSLSYEIAFYLIAALFAFGVRGAVRAGVVIAGCLAVALLIFYPRALFFAVGVLVWWGRERPVPAIVRLAGLMIGALATWFWGLHGLRTILGPDPAVGLTGAEITVLIGALCGVGLIVWGRLERQTPGNRIARAMGGLGRISYSFYLWHSAVMWVVLSVIFRLDLPTGPNLLLFTLLSAAGSLIMAWLSWRFVETRFYGKWSGRLEEADHQAIRTHIKFRDLKSIGHNIADSVGSGISLLVGAYEVDIFGEIRASADDHLLIDFITGTSSGAPTSEYLAEVISRLPEGLADLCAKHSVAPEVFKVLQARYAVDQRGEYFVVTVEDQNGRRSVDTYWGSPGRRGKHLDHLGRIRTKRS